MRLTSKHAPGGMWHTLRIKYGVYVPRQEVASLLKIMDPNGVAERKRHIKKKRV